MLIIASAIAALIPMITYLFLIWKFDRYDREPIGLVLASYFWGSVGAIVLAFIGSLIFSSFLSFFVSDKTKLEYLGTVITAPVVEESVKGLFLLLLVKNRKFDNMTDGIVYGGAIGLGFGMTENFLYFVSYGSSLSNWIAIVIVRSLFSAVMHCVSTATFGAFLGYAKFKGTSYKLTLPLTGLILAILIHFVWNFSVSFQQTALLGFLFMLVTIVIFITVFTASITAERKIIFKELSTEADTGLIPEKHAEILSSKKRNRTGWINENIRQSYIKAATTLAFRKAEFQNAKGKSKLFYQNDIEKYRQFIQNLLSGHTDENGIV